MYRVDPLLDEENIGNNHFGNFHPIYNVIIGELGNGPKHNISITEC